MKKLMFAAAVAASMVAVADVASQNCVGYVNPETFGPNNTMFGPMFIKIGGQTESGGKISVQSIVPQGDAVPKGKEDPLTDSAIEFKLLTAYGAADTAVYWRDCETGSGSRKKTWYGWYGDGETSLSTLELTAGQAAWVKMPAGASCTLTVSGQVPAGDVYYPLNDLANTAVCNPMPTTISIQDITPVSADPVLYPVPKGKEDPLTDSAIEFKLLTAYGATDTAVYWRDCETGSGSRKKTWYGWYGDGETSLSTMTLKPGEGAWVKNPGEKISLTFKGVLPAAE